MGGGWRGGGISPLNARLANLDIQSSDISAVENRVREVIPVPDSLGKETTFIGLYTSRWKLKCLGVTISTTPNL